MTGVYACLFEAVCDVTTVPSHLKNKFLHRFLLFLCIMFFSDFLKCIIGFFSFSFTHRMYLSGECVRDTCLTEYTDVQVSVTMHAHT